MKENNQLIEEFIITRFKVSHHKLPFYFKWIQMYNHFAKSNGSSDNMQEIFIKNLGIQYPDWQVEQADKELRLQNKSLQTEHSYIHWVKRFGKYNCYKIPGSVNQDDVKAFF